MQVYTKEVTIQSNSGRPNKSIMLLEYVGLQVLYGHRAIQKSMLMTSLMRVQQYKIAIDI